MKRKRITWEDAKRTFEEEGCELLEKEYSTSHTSMSYRCSCGNISKITLSNFKTGHRCKKCGTEKAISKERHNLEYLKEFFKERDCTLLSTEYKSKNDLLDYICSCGKISKIAFTNFQQGHRCRTCGRERTSEKQRRDWEEIKELYEKAKCKLLSEKSDYKCADSKLKYICNCGYLGYTRMREFEKGTRCKRCILQKMALRNVNTFRYKIFVLPSGKKALIQGYEDFFLRDILEHHSEENLLIGPSVIPIEYHYMDVNRLYYPDVIDIEERTVYEVKSYYTWNLEIHKNIAKFQGCIDKGYKAVLVVYSKNGKCLLRKEYTKMTKITPFQLTEEGNIIEICEIIKDSDGFDALKSDRNE